MNDKLLTLRDVLALPPETRVQRKHANVPDHYDVPASYYHENSVYSVYDVLADYRIVQEPAKPVVFEFEAVSRIDDTARLLYIADELVPLAGRRVRVTVEALGDES